MMQQGDYHVRRFDWMAIVIGALTDTIGTIFFMSLYGVIAAFVSDAQHLPSSEMEARLQRPAVTIALMIVGLGFTVLGGYVAGKISKIRQVMHGGIVGVVGIVLTLLSWGSAPLWYDIAALATVVPCGMLGGRIAETAQAGNSGLSELK